MLKRITFICFVSLTLIITFSSCKTVEQKREEKRAQIRAAAKQKFEERKQRQEELYLTQGPSWEQFEKICKKFEVIGRPIPRSRFAMNIFYMLFAKTDLFADPKNEVSLDNRARFQHRLPYYDKLLNIVFWDAKQNKGRWTNWFACRMYGIIASNAVRVSPEDVRQIVGWLNPRAELKVTYSKPFAEAVLQTSLSTSDNYHVSENSWYFYLKAACVLGNIARMEEILNTCSIKCKKYHYFDLMLDACRCNNPDIFKFLLWGVDSADEGYSNDYDYYKSQLPKEAAALPDNRCLSFLLGKYNFAPDILIAAIQSAVKTNSTENVFCLTKKFAEVDKQTKKSYFVDCSTPLIKGNTAILKALKRADIQISLDSLPAIISDNGPTVLASIDAVMEGKTPFLLASKSNKMDKAMLSAAAVGNVEVLKKLIQYGGEVNCMDENEKSPLAIAKEKNHRDCIAYLESLNAVSGKFRLRVIQNERKANLQSNLQNSIEKYRQIGIKKYKDDLSKRQAQMLKELSGKERLLVETLMKAKIRKENPRLVYFNLTFARAKVFNTADQNRFVIQIFPELTPEIKQIRNEWEQSGKKGIIKNLSYTDRVVMDYLILTDFKYPETADVSVLLDGDMVRILNTSPKDVRVKFD